MVATSASARDIEARVTPRIPLRVLIFWTGVALWLVNMIAHTGSAGLLALCMSLAFLAEIMVITSATRTITLDRVATTYCLGGAMMAVMWLLAYGFTSIQPDGHAVSRKIFAPLMEESLKLAPVAYFLWRQRRARLWSMGASDVLLLAAASGAGFGLVEDAFIQHRFGAWHPVDWLPTTAVFGNSLTAGHQTWTSLAGATLGLALLWRPRKPFVYLLGASGLLWSMLDHFRTNYTADRSGLVVDFLHVVTGHGWLALYFLVIGLILVVATDLNVVERVLPPIPELKTPIAGLLSFDKSALATWKFLLTRRALAFVSFHYRREPPAVRSELDPILANLVDTLVGLRDKITPGLGSS